MTRLAAIAPDTSAALQAGRLCSWCGEPIPEISPKGRRTRKDVRTCPDWVNNGRCRKASFRFGARGPSVEIVDAPRRFAYADPPYPGMAEEKYGDHPDFAGEVDHRELLDRLVDEFPDGWALSTSSKTLAEVLALHQGGGLRLGAWVHPAPPRGYKKHAATAWEPVIFCGGRARPRDAPQLLDWSTRRWRGGVAIRAGWSA